MKTKLLFVVSALAVAAVAVWAWQKAHADSQKNYEIAALQTKVNTLTHEVTAAKNQGARIVEVVNSTPGANVNPAPKALPSGPAPISASPEIIAGLRDAVSTAIAMPPGPDRDKDILKVLPAWASVDGPGALAESVELTGGNRGRVRIEIFDSWSAAQPAEAADAPGRQSRPVFLEHHRQFHHRRHRQKLAEPGSRRRRKMD